MNYPHKKINTFLFTAILAACANDTIAEEIQKEDSQQQTEQNNRDGYFLSIGAGHLNQESPLREAINGWQIVVNGRYQWKGLFVELASGPSGADTLPAVGYNFYSTDHWNLDLIGAITSGRAEFNYELDGEAKQLSSGITRGAGLRAVGAWGNTVLQVVALPYSHGDVESDSAVDYASLWLGHRWQIKNWSLNGLVGAKYHSSGLMDYHLGVNESEADAVVDAYEPSAGIDYTAQIDLTYPINKNVLFQIYSRHTEYSDEAMSSPLVVLSRKWDNRPEQEREFGVLLNYVF